jgi:hypothetical protein
MESCFFEIMVSVVHTPLRVTKNEVDTLLRHSASCIKGDCILIGVEDIAERNRSLAFLQSLTRQFLHGRKESIAAPACRGSSLQLVKVAVLSFPDLFQDDFFGRRKLTKIKIVVRVKGHGGRNGVARLHTADDGLEAMLALLLLMRKLLPHGTHRLALRRFHEPEECTGFYAVCRPAFCHFRSGPPAVDAMGFGGIGTEQDSDHLDIRIAGGVPYLDETAADVILAGPEEKQPDLNRHFEVVLVGESGGNVHPSKRFAIRSPRTGGGRLGHWDPQRYSTN